MLLCDKCGEEKHVQACFRPPFVSRLTWMQSSAGKRAFFEHMAISCGYVWTDSGGWNRALGNAYGLF